MTGEPWTEPTWTVDQLRKLGKKISSLVRANRVTSPISTLLLSAMALEVGLFIYASFAPLMLPGSTVGQLASYLVGPLVLTGMVSMAVYIVAGNINDRLSYLLERYNKIGVVVKIRCEKCGRTDERTWSNNDYIFKEEGTCACGGPRFISQVYLMPLPLKKPLPEQH